jgi:hypothetical protein
MSHAVLLGDSIFDNARYVPDRPPVIDQVRRGLPRGIGGNDALAAGGLLDQSAGTVGEALTLLGQMLTEFRDRSRRSSAGRRSRA